MDSLIRLFDQYAHRLPLEVFVFVGSFTEEAISPIPSFVVMIPAGAAAQVQGLEVWYLGVLALFGAAGRIIASVMLYFLADKTEDWIFGKGRRFFGVSHKEVEKFGRRLSGTRRDWIVLFLLNAVPILPTSFLSVACGFIKVDRQLFITATFFGSAVNAFAYMYIGYEGVRAASALRSLDLAFQITTVVLLIGLVVGFMYYYRRKKRGR